jgi:arylsulfatase A-like enzyme
LNEIPCPPRATEPVNAHAMKTNPILLLFASLACFAGISAGAPTPNILLIFVDNLGYGDLGCYGNAAVKTPNIDRLAKDGVRCTDFYIGSPSCAPSRGAILSGRHPERTGFNYQALRYAHLPGKAAEGDGLPREEKVIPHYLKPLGYATAAFGKWNIGFMPGSRPTERGFDEFLGNEGGNMGYYSHLYHGKNDMRRGTEPVDLRGQYTTDLFADHAVDFIKRHREQPWFVYLPFNAVHSVSAGNVEPGEKIEYQVPAKYLALYGCKPDEPDPILRFRAVLTALDDAIGRVLATIDDLALRERTLVLCISDNGAFPVKAGEVQPQSNAPLRGYSGATYEGGLRVPAMMRWPGKIPPGTVCREMLSTLDVLPLIVGAAGGTLPNDRVLDGRDPLPVLAGNAPSPHRSLHWVWNVGRKEQWRALREGPMKLVRPSDKSAWELYDLSVDIGETKDLAAEHPELVRELAGKSDAWHRGVKAERKP